MEFLLAGESFYFLEVNTRIQVEHAVTEATTGLDLVRLQLEIAAGQPLPFTQRDIGWRGHAIEARVYAEDAGLNFLPSTGPVQALVPPQGPGIRNDVGVEVGDSITMYYDPMIAKLIVHAETRPLALRRLQQALDRYVCVGPTTNLPFLQWIAHRPEFPAGEVDIGFIERDWHPTESALLPLQALIAAALVDVSKRRVRAIPGNGLSGWRMSGLPRPFQYESDERLWLIGYVPGKWRYGMSWHREARPGSRWLTSGRARSISSLAVQDALYDRQSPRRVLCRLRRHYLRTAQTPTSG